MALEFPANRKEVADRMATDTQNELPALTPQIRNSFSHALIIGVAGRLFDIYKQLQALESQLFLFTATEFTFIERWGLQRGVFIKDAARATGLITVTGTEGSIIV